MTTLVLKLSVAQAARLEQAWKYLGLSREQVAQQAIRLLLQSVTPEPKRKTRKA